MPAIDDPTRPSIEDAVARAPVTVTDSNGTFTARLVYWPLPPGTRKKAPRGKARGYRARVLLPSGAALSVHPDRVTLPV